jgi:hypothetical protein
MDFILGAALIVSAMALLNAGRLAVERTCRLAPRRETLVTDIFAVAFTGLMGPGLILFVLGLTKGLDAAQLGMLSVSLALVVIGSKFAARTFRRLAAAPVAVPVTGAQPQ